MSLDPTDVQVPSGIRPAQRDVDQTHSPVPSQIIQQGIAGTTDREAVTRICQQLEKDGIGFAGASAKHPMIRSSAESAGQRFTSEKQAQRLWIVVASLLRR